MSYSHPAEDRSALKGTGNLTQTKTWAKYQHTMLSERRQSVTKGQTIPQSAS